MHRRENFGLQLYLEPKFLTFYETNEPGHDQKLNTDNKSINEGDITSPYIKLFAGNNI